MITKKPNKISFNLPQGFVLKKNILTNYDPIANFSVENNLFYLQEDLVQIENQAKGIIIDLGWYGELTKNNGNFKIYVVKDLNWDEPINVLESKSINEICNMFKQELNERASA